MQKSSAYDWDWLSAGLLFLMLQVAAGRLLIANWAPFLYFAETLTTLGTVLGLALGMSRFKRQMVIWIAIAYTVIVLAWQWIAVVQSDTNFRERLSIIASRLAIAFVQFIQRTPVNDSFLFIAFISLVMWIISLTAGYQLIRHDNLLAAVIPSAIVMVIVQVYDNYFSLRSWWLAAYLFLVLLLMGRRYFLRSRIQWKTQHIAVSEDAWLDILNGLTIVALIVVLIAWIFPTSLSGLQAASHAWNEISNPVQNRLSNAVVSLQSPQSPYSNGGADFYSDSLALGRNAPQSRQPVFTVKILSAPASPTPYYWRGRVYDFYADGQWTNSSATSLDFQPSSQNLSLVDAQNRTEAQLQFTVQLPRQSLLYAPSEPVWVDQPGSVSVDSIANGQNDPFAWFANPPIAQGGRYQVRAEIDDPTVTDLEAAGMSYPSWVQDRYLEVPQNIQVMIQTLADKVVSGQSTPYDKTQAITNYLRNTIQYSTTVPSPPPNEDPAVWVLFNYKKGFCNYYASAEILMLRSIGIPARLAVGFAEGETNNNLLGDHTNGESYTVLSRDAHAWPEVYFPGIGWVEFEPTVSQGPIVRPESKSQIANQQNNSASNANANKPNQNASSESGTFTKLLMFNNPLLSDIVLVVSILIISSMIFVFRRYRLLNQMPTYLSTGLERVGVSTPSWMINWIHWNQMTSVERSFSSINLSLRWLGSPQPIYATAAERASELAKLLPSAKEHIEAVSSEHQSALFTERSADVTRARRAGMIIIYLTLRFKLLNFWSAIFGGDVYSE